MGAAPPDPAGLVKRFFAAFLLAQGSEMAAPFYPPTAPYLTPGYLPQLASTYPAVAGAYPELGPFSTTALSSAQTVASTEPATSNAPSLLPSSAAPRLLKDSDSAPGVPSPIPPTVPSIASPSLPLAALPSIEELLHPLAVPSMAPSTLIPSLPSPAVPFMEASPSAPAVPSMDASPNPPTVPFMDASPLIPSLPPPAMPSVEETSSNPPAMPPMEASLSAPSVLSMDTAPNPPTVPSVASSPLIFSLPPPAMSSIEEASPIPPAVSSTASPSPLIPSLPPSAMPSMEEAFPNPQGMATPSPQIPSLPPPAVPFMEEASTNPPAVLTMAFPSPLPSSLPPLAVPSMEVFPTAQTVPSMDASFSPVTPAVPSLEASPNPLTVPSVMASSPNSSASLFMEAQPSPQVIPSLLTPAIPSMEVSPPSPTLPSSQPIVPSIEVSLFSPSPPAISSGEASFSSPPIPSSVTTTPVPVPAPDNRPVTLVNSPDLVDHNPITEPPENISGGISLEDRAYIWQSWSKWYCNCPAGSMSRVRDIAYRVPGIRLTSTDFIRRHFQRVACDYKECLCSRLKKECEKPVVACQDLEQYKCAMKDVSYDQQMQSRSFWSQIQGGMRKVWKNLGNTMQTNLDKKQKEDKKGRK
ncbi:proline-rich protein 36-like [Rhinatrema bivittatum]|uniref:proline-rich protein 36-like n=1 Tax=Rhinatrema bivittatum TaxID=194408 RepID=UPI00112D4A4B|nr:proline-rich protein 36-like [Rhinatrema bivittatum]